MIKEQLYPKMGFFESGVFFSNFPLQACDISICFNGEATTDLFPNLIPKSQSQRLVGNGMHLQVQTMSQYCDGGCTEDRTWTVQLKSQSCQDLSRE